MIRCANFSHWPCDSLLSRNRCQAVREELSKEQLLTADLRQAHKEAMQALTLEKVAALQQASCAPRDAKPCSGCFTLTFADLESL